MPKRESVRVRIPVHVPYTATPALAQEPALDSDIAHEYSDYKIPAFRNQMSLADFTQFQSLIWFSFESFSAELSWIFLAGGT